MATSFKASTRPDMLLRKYAWFEDPAPAPDPAPPAPAVFTPEQQAVIDKLVGGARGEGKKSALTDTLKELGFDKLEDLKTLVKSAKEQDEAKKTEAQKLADAKTQAEKERDEAKAALDTERAKRLTDQRDGKLKDALTAAKIKPDRVNAALKLLTVEQAEALQAAVKADGSIDDKAITKIAEDAKKAYPEWFGVGGVGTHSNSDGRIREPGDQDRQTAARATSNALRGRL